MLVATHYDMVGNVTRKIEDSGGIGRYTDSMYDRAGRLTRITGYPSATTGGQHTDYAYDKAGKMTRTTYPDDTSGGGGDRGYVVNTFDVLGRVTRINHQDNTNTDLVYDSMSRPSAITKGTEIDTFGYTDWGALASAERGTSANPDAVSKVERAYDGLNRMTRESQSIREGSVRHVDYAYDKAANVLTLTYPGGTEIVTSYDALHRGDVVKKDGSQIADYGYTGPQHTSLVLETGANDVTLSLAYDGAQAGRLTRMTYAQTGSSGLPDYSYAFDASSNITRKTFNHRSGTPSEDYLHDTLDRLTKTTFGQRTSTPYEGFVYDDLGNHLTQDQNGTAVAGLFNSVNEQTKRDGNDVTWDLRGNLTADDDGKEYFYDRQNLLMRVEDGSSNRIASYAYDALGRRIEKDVEDAGGDIVTRFYYNGSQMIEETDDAGTPSVEREYVWAPSGGYIDDLLLFTDASGNDYFAARHHHFNVMALLDATDGSVVERYEYNPYGRRFVLDADYADDADGLSDVGLNIGHQGLLYDVESGLIYNRARMLHPVIGRFMQRDPLGYVDGMSVYAYYAGMNGGVDPYGLTSIFQEGWERTILDDYHFTPGAWSDWELDSTKFTQELELAYAEASEWRGDPECICTIDFYSYAYRKKERTRTRSLSYVRYVQKEYLVMQQRPAHQLVNDAITLALLAGGGASAYWGEGIWSNIGAGVFGLGLLQNILNNGLNVPQFGHHANTPVWVMQPVQKTSGTRVETERQRAMWLVSESGIYSHSKDFKASSEQECVERAEFITSLLSNSSIGTDPNAWETLGVSYVDY